VRGFIDGEYQDGPLRGCTFVAGERGMGKTTLVANLLSVCDGGVMFFDPLARHESLLPGRKLFFQPGPLQEYLRINRERRFKVLYQPRDGDIDEHFRALCLIARAFGRMIFAVDELDMFCGPRWGDRRMPPCFYDLVNYGRHAQVSMIATARYPMSVPRGFTSQCAQMYLFHETEPDHITYFRRYIGSADALSLSALEKYQYLHWNGDGPAQLCGGRR